MINYNKKTVDLEFFKTVLKEVRNRDINISDRLLDSLSYTQFESKFRIIEMLYNTGLISKNSEITVFGCWFNSILAATLHKDVKSITGYDLDKNVINTAKKIFKNQQNVHFYIMDIFKNFNDVTSNSNLLINTSCEHMPPMNTWPFWHRIKKNTYFLFQSHNLTHIEDHINCVNSIEEFKNQMPKKCKILHTDILEETMRDEKNGKRFTLIGQKI